MGWKDAITYARASLASHGVEAAKVEVRADDELPFKMRIGSLLTLQLNPFVTAEIGGSIMTTPQQAMTIKAISRLRLDMAGQIFRAYVSTGDKDDKNEVFLQLYVGTSGEVEEAMYCTRLTRFYPETAEDQANFTGESGVGLGQKTYALSSDQLIDLGLAPSLVKVVCGEAGQLEYTRSTGGSELEYVPPFVGTESRVDDATGDSGLTQSVYFMPYARSIGLDGMTSEHLLISCETVASIDGDASKREIHVDFMVGLTLDKERFTIQ